MQPLRGDGGIGIKETEHGGHIGLYHSCALDYPRHSQAFMLHSDLLGSGVCGHNGPLCRQAGGPVAPQISRCFLEEALNLAQVQVPAYDPGGSHADFGLISFQKIGQQPGHGPGVLQAPRTGIGVGTAAVGDDPIQMAADEIGSGDRQRRRSHPVGGKHSCGSTGGGNQGQAVLSPTHSCRPHPRNGTYASLNPLHASSPDRR